MATLLQQWHTYSRRGGSMGSAGISFGADIKCPLSESEVTLRRVRKCVKSTGTQKCLKTREYGDKELVKKVCFRGQP